MSKFRQPSISLCRVLLAVIGLAGMTVKAQGNTTLFFQNFELSPPHPLSPSESYPQVFLNAFSHNPPAGWSNDVISVPTGRPEWRGWSFARQGFWNNSLVGGGRRQEFQLGQGTIAVADPQEWNELGNPADNLGFFNSTLTTPFINLTTPDQGSKKLMFDSSWFGGDCCDDGNGTNNQTAKILLRFPNGTAVQVLRWEAAPFINSMGVPSPVPAPGFSSNPFFKPTATNERVLIDLSPYLANVTFNQLRLEFSLMNAGDDGWWAYDTVQMFSLSLEPGDMNIDGEVNDFDIPAFALGVQSVDAYRDAYYGEFPVTRGSPDSVFDFDDIPWFISLLDSSGVGSAAAKVQAALAGATVPEPPTAFLIMFGMHGICSLRRTPRAVNATR
jgi:hypothetical protein